ncbi:chemotaxis protein CheD [candidate division KSB1 bacterium]|nr:MAG: chemotaxis protein CheD [candidate division KSB1 bacterium]
MTAQILTERRLVVGVADMKMTNRESDVIVTHALGSCIGIAIYDPTAMVGGILHFMLPDASANPQRAAESPWMFGSTAIPAFFKKAYELGATKPRLIVKVAGGAQFLDDKEFFAIGKRNHTMMRKIFWQNGVLTKTEHVGGTVSRTLFLEMSSGRIWIATGGKEIDL